MILPTGISPVLQPTMSLLCRGEGFPEDFQVQKLSIPRNFQTLLSSCSSWLEFGGQELAGHTGTLVPAAPCAPLRSHHGQPLLSPPQQDQIHSLLPLFPLI